MYWPTRTTPELGSCRCPLASPSGKFNPVAQLQHLVAVGGNVEIGAPLEGARQVVGINA